jgi:hypothetical protein
LLEDGISPRLFNFPADAAAAAVDDDNDDPELLLFPYAMDKPLLREADEATPLDRELLPIPLS